MMNKNAEAIKSAYARKEQIAVLLYKGAVILEEIEQDLSKRSVWQRPLTGRQLFDLDYRKGKLEDAQQELPAEAEDLQKYIDRLLDPEAEWPAGKWDDQERRLLCAEQRKNISHYTGVKKFL